MSQETQIQTSVPTTELYKQLQGNDFVQRPWGGYRVLDFQFQGKEVGVCKYLFVYPGQQLSWQYHYNREEKWVILTLGLEYNFSDTDDYGPWLPCQPGDVLYVPRITRHSCRNVGSEVGIIAETWISNGHTSEDDIVRVQDKYGRS